MSCASATPVVIIRGEDRTLLLKIENTDKEPLSIVGATEIEARFKNADGTILSKKLTTAGVSVVSGIGGKVSVILTDTESGLLKLGENQSFTLIVDIGSTRRRVNFNKVLNIVEPSA